MAKNNYGFRIYRKRKKLGITQGQLAKEVGLTTVTISKIENGISTPSLHQLIKISEQLALRFMVCKDGVLCCDDIDITPEILK